MKKFVTPTSKLTSTLEGVNQSLRQEDGTPVTDEELQAAYKDLSALGFWVRNKSRHLKDQPPRYISSIDEKSVYLMTYTGGTVIQIPKSLFHKTYDLL